MPNIALPECCVRGRCLGLLRLICLPESGRGSLHQIGDLIWFISNFLACAGVSAPN